jgi:hypothetical protein
VWRIAPGDQLPTVDQLKIVTRCPRVPQIEPLQNSKRKA